MAITEQDVQASEDAPSVNYLNNGYGLKSWLLTKDHKRIAVLYIISISIFFALGGLFASLVRFELMTPEGDLMSSDTYNKVFSMHGIIMVFFFLVPSIPATIGNFLVPIMVGAKDLAFPRVNLLSWYVYVVAGILGTIAVVGGGVDTGWTFYTPYSSTYSNSNVILAAMAAFMAGFSSISDRTQLRGDNPHHARAGDDLVPPTAVRLVALCHQFDYAVGHTRYRNYTGTAHARARVWIRLFRSEPRWRSRLIPALVLVLFASSRLYHDLAFNGRDERNGRRCCAQARLWI